MRHVLEDGVKRWGRTTVQVRRAGEHRDQRGNVDPIGPPGLDVGHVVRPDLVAHAIREEVRVEGAHPAEELDELGVDDLGLPRAAV